MWTSSRERPEIRFARAERNLGRIGRIPRDTSNEVGDLGLHEAGAVVPFRLGGKHARFEGALRADAQRRSRLGVVSGLGHSCSTVHALYVSWEWHEKNCNWDRKRVARSVRPRDSGDLEITRDVKGDNPCYRWLWIDNYHNSSVQFYLFED